uniref:Uncharacterized protein n=1 Tax=Leersia perrieri TaxID=77586 RepID=A0A0D9XIY0_9ORYZ
MASMGFSYAQIHVQQERCKRTNDQKMKKMMAEEKEKENKQDMCEGEEEKKFMSADEKTCYSWTMHVDLNDRRRLAMAKDD